MISRLLIALSAACVPWVLVPAASALSCIAPKYPLADQVPVVVVGQALDGPVLPAGPGALVSPARLRVERYEKGAGPGELAFDTAHRSDGGTMAGFLEPRPGDWLRLYGTVTGDVIDTSPCQGSRVIAGPDAPPDGPPPAPKVYVPVVEAGGLRVRAAALPAARATLPVVRPGGRHLVVHGVPAVSAMLPGRRRAVQGEALGAGTWRWRVRIGTLPRTRRTQVTIVLPEGGNFAVLVQPRAARR